ncbi:methyltransferase [Streptomyces sp. NPDC090025]|uniref:methyltransferase n=1 Tax=Streptomyces sp. NPDC090025 TaxID=3365922 RepID=UPI0038349AE9
MHHDQPPSLTLARTSLTSRTPGSATATLTAVATAPDDRSRLEAAAGFVREHDTPTLLAQVLPGLDGPELRALTDRCRFAHTAVLVFPPDERALREQLAGCGLPDDVPTQPSVVVRDRLAVRHRLAAGNLDVRILRPGVTGADGERRVVEVFALTVPPGSPLSAVAAAERRHDHEAHIAFDVTHPDPLVLRGLLGCFARYGAVPDGGGYNPHEDGTVFYFTAPDSTKTPYRRVELYAGGDHRDVLAEHLGHPLPDEASHAGDGADGATGAAGHRAAESLLWLLTGAWTTQALAACVELRLPEAMDRAAHQTPDPQVPAPQTPDPAPAAAPSALPPGVPELAGAVGADPQSLATLLRYLAMIGVVRATPTGFRVTDLGALLRADAPRSMRPLALMYGGPFYQSFAHLAHTVRSGQPGFEHLYGENHFDHFARDAELAAVFDASMVSSAALFDALPAHPVLTAAAHASGHGGGRARTVVDIAGGTGQLLAHVLTAHPALRGVLLERPQVLAAARARLAHADAEVAGRCDFRAGDFADVPDGGDVYLLSRVLHDWDDDRCRDILGHCARAMSPDADLLIVERLLPPDNSPSLATAWDLHMMCNTGGRERTAEHYARLLDDRGLVLIGHSPLGLGGHALHARRA